MNIPDEFYNESKSYFLTTMGGLIIVMAFNLLSNVMRAMGSTTILLVYMILSHILNLLLDIVLIVVFSFGVKGVSIATIVSQLVVGFCIYRYLVKHYPVLRLTKNDWHVKTDEIWLHLTVSLPIGIQYSIISIGNIVLQYKLNSLTHGNIEGHAIAARMEGIVTAPLLTIGLATSTFVAQNYGAGKMNRIWQGIRTSLSISFIYSTITGIILYFKGSEIAHFLIGSTNQATMDSIEFYFKMTAQFYIFLAVLFVLRFSIQGMGRSVAPTLSGIIEMFIRSFIPLFFAGTAGFTAIVLSHPISWFSTAVIMATTLYMITKEDGKHRWRTVLTK